jgi:hypothetical protein
LVGETTAADPMELSMSFRTRPATRLLRLAVVAVLAAAMVVPAMAASAHVNLPRDGSSAETPVQRLIEQGRIPAEDVAQAADLLNFEHVYGRDPGGAAGAAKGTDVEFFSPSIPQRDPSTGEPVLDASGNPVLEVRDFAVVGAYDRGAFIFDITSPATPQFVVNIPCNQRQNDVQIKQFGSRWVLAMTKDADSGASCIPTNKGGAGLAGIALFDISDPYAVKSNVAGAKMYSFGVRNGAHNFTFHPTKPYGYVSTGEIGGGQGHVPIIDFTDLMAPKLAADPTLVGSPHDISFNADGSRAYLAAENNMAIWNTTNPVAPTEISISAGPASYVHGADPTPDGKHVIFTDESLVLGGFFTSRKSVCPGGGITIYDIAGANEARPVPLGFGVANIQGVDPAINGACTAHVGKITANSKYYVTGWYRGGARVFDISDPAKPTDIGHAMMPGTEVWAAKFYKGDYVYSADMQRGFDVFRWTGPTLGNPPTAAQLAAQAQ